MRPLRWLILAAILVIAGLVGRAFYVRNNMVVPPKPAAELPKGVDVKAQEWSFSQTENGKVKVRLRARDFAQVKETSKLHLEGVTLEIPRGGDAKRWDQIKTEKAEFDQTAQTLWAEGDVEIIMDVPEGAEPTGKLIKITTSGVKFEKAGKAFTDKPVKFAFDRGEGSSVGATYDINTRELHLQDDVHLTWKGSDPKAVPLEVETKEAIYKETDSMVLLKPWSKLKRGPLRMEAAESNIKLKNGLIDEVDAKDGRGVQEDPGRKVEYSAAQMLLKFTEKGQMRNADGEGNAQLTSTSATGITHVTCSTISLEFEPKDKDTLLKKAWARGNTVVDSKPVMKPGVPPADTRILRSDQVELRMRGDGQEIESAETHAPSELDIVPNQPKRPKRWLAGSKFWISYAPGNHLESFRTVQASTRSLKPGEKHPTLTWSDELKAAFNPKTDEMTVLEQDRNFRYEAGDRKATANRAVLEQPSEVITLTGAARAWDATSSTTGDTITMNQSTGDTVANGNVTSTRLPDKKDKSSAMLSNEETTQATALKMTTTKKNSFIRYEGNAVAWQGSNRVAADTIEIDRELGILRAIGNVVSQFADKPKKETAAAGNKAAGTGPTAKGKQPAKKTQPPKPGAPVFTVVKADRLVYTEEDHIAVYTVTDPAKTQARLDRPGMTVTGRQIRAYLNDDDAGDSSFSRAVAEGDVRIVQTAGDRVRTGTSEHADYYPDEGKILLEGGQPQFVDSLKGRTTGRQLTYFSNDERLLVDGLEQKLAESVLKRK